MKPENVEVQQAPQGDSNASDSGLQFHQQWLKEVQILQILSFLDSQRIWEESFEEEEIIYSICMTRNYLGMGGGIGTICLYNSVYCKV